MPMIIGEIRRYLRDNNMIRVSRSVRDIAYKALAAKEKLSALLSREPTVEEICAQMNKTLMSEAELSGHKDEVKLYCEKDIVDALDAVVEPISLYDPIYSDNGDSLYIMDQLCDNSVSDNDWTENIALCEAMKKLGEREKAIIDMRFYQGKTQMEVAGEVGISQAQVSRLEKCALERIKKQI